MKRTTAMAALLAGLGLCLAGCTGAPSAPAPTSAPPPQATAATASSRATAAPAATPQATKSIKMAVTSTAPSNWPYYVAVAKGYLKDEGISVQTVQLSSSVTQTDALLAGEINLNIYTVDSVAKPVRSGAPMLFIASAQSVPNAQLIVGKEIHSWADLKGKTIATGAKLGYFDILARAMLAANGLKSGDYKTISIGSSAARLPALESDQVQAMLVSGPDDAKAIAAGYKSFGTAGDFVKDVEYNGYAVNGTWAKANEATVVGFLRAMQRGVDFVYDPANKAEALTIFQNATHLAPPYVEELYQEMVPQKMLTRNMRPNLPGITNFLTMSVQMGALQSIPPLDSWVDLSYLDKAESSLGKS